MHLSGEDAMERALTGSSNEARLGELYVRHVGAAIGLARLMIGDDQQAEDVAHEAFIRAAGRFDHLRRPEAFGAYLRSAVVNECRMRFRRARLERTWSRSQVAAEPVDPPDVETRTSMWEEIARLPWRQRAALVLRYYEDLPVEQVAALLKCSRRAASGLIVRGLAQLRQSLPKEEL
jgi:RNA polymerase sigma factor (sigma-70 family)